MNLSYQRRVAATVLKCGVNRVWIDDRPEVQERISEAVTRDDVRLLIVQRFIRKHQKKGISRGRAKAMAVQRSKGCLLYTSPSPRDATLSRMPSSA